MTLCGLSTLGFKDLQGFSLLTPETFQLTSLRG